MGKELTRYGCSEWGEAIELSTGGWVRFADAHAEIERLEARIKELEDAANILTAEVSEGSAEDWPELHVAAHKLRKALGAK